MKNIKKRTVVIILAVILGLFALLYLCGMLSQLYGNYAAWKSEGGITGGSDLRPVNWNPLVCIGKAFSPNGLKSLLAIALIGGLIFAIYELHDRFDNHDRDPRGFAKSKSGAYGTASWMTKKEIKEHLEVATPEEAQGVILGELDGKAVCMPKDTKLNRHIAVFGASGTMKSRAVIRNALFQALKQNESVVITDPKGELYADTAELYKQNGYEVKVFNLVSPEHSDSWNCMADLCGDTLMAQVLTNVIIGNTGSDKGDRFWDTQKYADYKSVYALCIGSARHLRLCAARFSARIFMRREPERTDVGVAIR